MCHLSYIPIIYRIHGGTPFGRPVVMFDHSLFVYHGRLFTI